MAEIGFIGEEMDLRIRQGADFGPMELEMVNPDGSAVDLTGATIRGHIRKTPTGPLIVALTCEITDPTNGKYQFSLTAAQTRVIKAVEDPKSRDNRYLWDLELEDSLERVTPLYYGVVWVFREVTR